MILKKPYAFFIRIFKPVHIMIAIMMSYLIALNNNIYSFFNEYIYDISIIKTTDLSKLVNNYLIIIPIVVIIISLIIIGVLYRKNKNILFYFIIIFSLIVTVIINSYSISFIKTIEDSTVLIKSAKLIKDLSMINIILESAILILFIIRGFGINIKKFDFESELSKFELDESDSEEFELDLKLDLESKKAKRNKRLRNFKYYFYENKFKIIILSILLFLMVFFVIFIIIYSNKNYNENEDIIFNNLIFNVDNTMIINTDYNNSIITDNYLIVVKVNLKSFENISYKNFKLIINDLVFSPTLDYSDELSDIGYVYNSQESYGYYLFVYEVPKEYINSNMMLRYSYLSTNLKVNLNPKKYINNYSVIESNLGSTIQFNDLYSDINFIINNYEINKKYILEYDYCMSDKTCFLSKEVLTPSINENFDKVILKLDINYNYENNSDFNTFYKLLYKYGCIEYKIGDTWYSQNTDFEEIKSNKIKKSNIIYIGVNSDVMLSSNINFVFNIRDKKYIYTLK